MPPTIAATCACWNGSCGNCVLQNIPLSAAGETGSFRDNYLTNMDSGWRRGRPINLHFATLYGEKTVRHKPF